MDSGVQPSAGALDRLPGYRFPSQKIASGSHFEVLWDSGIRAVVLIGSGFLAGSELTTAFARTIQVLGESRSQGVLLEFADIGTISRTEQAWLLDHWFNDAVGAGARWLAIVEPHRTIAKMVVDRLTNELLSLDLTIKKFTTVDLARNWLERVPNQGLDRSRIEDRRWGLA